MRSFLIALAVGGAVSVGPLSAQTPLRPFTIGISGGATFVTGEDRDFYNTGYNAQGSIGIPLPGLSMALRIDAMYHKIPGQNRSTQTVAGAPDTLFIGDLSLLGFTANAQFYTGSPTSLVRPYVIAGAGPYRIENKGVLYGQNVSASATKMGVTGGIGVTVNALATRLFAEARVHNVFADGGSARVYPLTVGFFF
jgi:hypothetical protein